MTGLETQRTPYPFPTEDLIKAGAAPLKPSNVHRKRIHERDESKHTGLAQIPRNSDNGIYRVISNSRKAERTKDVREHFLSV